MVGILYWLQALKTDHHQRRLIVSFLLFGVTAMSIRLLLLQSFILAIGKPPLLLPIESEAFPLYFSLQCCVFIRLFVRFVLQQSSSSSTSSVVVCVFRARKEHSSCSLAAWLANSHPRSIAPFFSSVLVVLLD